MKQRALRGLLLLPFAFTVALALTEEATPPPGESADGNHLQSYIVLMALEPAIRYEGGEKGLVATRPTGGAKIDVGCTPVKNYRQHLEGLHEISLKEAGVDLGSKVYDYTVALNGYSAILTAEQAEAIAAQPSVVRVMPDRMRHKQTDSSPWFLGLTMRGDAWYKGYTGKGVVVGVIDTGIWPEHPSFADNGSYDPPPITLSDTPGNPACEFGNSAHNVNDAPFSCNNKLIGARQMLATYRTFIGATPDEYDSARDDQGHGTHTASIATGNRHVPASILGIPLGLVSGIAPRAHVVAYKGLGRLGGFTSDLAAAIDQAVVDGVDVINYSIGGGATLTGADDLAFLFAADAGVFTATSTGNAGPNAGSINGPASVPWITSVGASTQPRFFEGSVRLGNGSAFHGASITEGTGELPLVDAENAGGDLCFDGSLDSSKVAGKIVLCRRGGIGRVAQSKAVFGAGGAGMILYNGSDVDTLMSDTHWVPTVHVDQTPGLAIKAYIAADPAPKARIEEGTSSVWVSAPSMGYFSSRGPNPVAWDIIKPDITAPGVQILGGTSPTPESPYYPGELFDAITSTSLSSPHVAGVYALLKQAHPDWSPAMARSAIMTTASQDVRDNDRVSPADPFDMGAGHLRPGGWWAKGSVAQPGLVYDAGFNEYLGFLCDAEPEIFTDPEDTCDFLESIGVPTEAASLNLPSIGIANLPGVKTVCRTVTNVSSGWRLSLYRAEVEPPPGFQVTVTPNWLWMPRGSEADYCVTIRSDGSVPVGEWSFGSLTWQDWFSPYRVRSPIAVRAVDFMAPGELSETGTTGSLSFGVHFGYNGDYTAAPHGLEAAVVTTDSVSQDPDQTFTPTDVGAGATLHSFVLSGEALFRVSLPPEAVGPNVDLDLFVYDPSGALVATSTSGGTDEQVDLLLPADGTWKVYVHGWSVPGGSASYTMDSWAVPLASGGSLSLDSAPATATLGTVGNVSVSWSGLAAAHYLGAVSHTGPAGLMQLTLIDVDAD